MNNIYNNILKHKKTSFWVSVAIIAIVVGIVVVLGTNPINEHKYQFPLKAKDIEKVLAEQGIIMYIKDFNGDDSRSIANLSNDKNMVFGINSQLRNNYEVLNMIWYLPEKLTSDEVNDFFKNKLSKHFELAGIFYGNKRELDKELNKMLSHYLDEKNYGYKFEWNEKVGNDHLKVQIKPMLDGKRNNIITLLIIPDELYEDYSRTLSNSRELVAQEIAKAYLMDLYTVDSKEVDNYKSMLNVITSDAKALSDTMQTNDEVLKSLMTEKAYDTLIKNRQNLEFAKACYEGNNIMEVSEIQLSENKNNIGNNEAGYNFKVLLKYISHDGTETTGTANGLIELEIIDGKWKITGYKKIGLN